MSALKPSYEKVALALADGLPQRQAAIAGGFNDNPASIHRLCKRPEIQERMREIRAGRAEAEAKARQIAAEKSGVDLAWCEIRLKHTIDLALRGLPVRDASGRIRRDPDNNQPIYKPDLAAAERAITSMIRYKGGFIDRQEIGGPGDFSRLADADLDRKIAELARAAGLPEETVLMIEDMSNRSEAAE